MRPVYMDLDKWAMDIEDAFEADPTLFRPELGRKHSAICRARDRIFIAKRIEAEKQSMREYGLHAIQVPKWCPERYGPPKGGSGVVPVKPTPPPTRSITESGRPKSLDPVVLSEDFSLNPDKKLE